ncbi:hypothetical protein A9Q81_12405 [Gammaproteobacteria bacterium 42_54_T18]|nr:hypothetical protein A9Q81_12405 [Gammaproteobacteria bacterium 42_54_T18]
MFVWIYTRKADRDGTKNIILLYNLALPGRSVQPHSNIFFVGVNNKIKARTKLALIYTAVGNGRICMDALVYRLLSKNAVS